MTSSSAGKRSCLLVLGMHRAGTSALAGMLVNMGAAQAQTLMKPHESNPRGFFESVAVRDFNDALLSRLGSSWRDWRTLPQGWPQNPEVQALESEAAKLVVAEFGESETFVVKDPRICRILPFWRSVLARVGVRVLVVHTHRHPDEVAASLAKRYDFEPAFSRLLWLRHVLEAEAGSRGLRRCFTSYDRLLSDPVIESTRIAHCLQLAPDPEFAVEAFISPDLRNYRIDSASSTTREPGLPIWCREALVILEHICSAKEKDLFADLTADDKATLDRIRVELDCAVDAVAPILDNDRVNERKLHRVLRDLKDCREKLADLQAALARARGEA